MEFPETSDNEQLQVILEAWFESLENGERPLIEDLCADAPELVSVVRRLVDQEEAATGALDTLRGGQDPEEGLNGTRLGDFRVLSFLGAGGMGQVYLARQESLGRLVALKVLTRDGQDSSAAARFQREAEIAAALDHAHIVPVYAVGEEGGFSFLAMKWLSGPALDQLESSLPPRDVARIGLAIARGLHAAHETGVIHRDIKPGNIMLDGDTPFVLDFGLARGASDLTLTRRGTVPGTLLYMSPEQLRAGHSGGVLDGRTDVYSLGATLYQAVSGRPPFQASDPEVLIRQVLMVEPAELNLSGGARDLETIILRAMSKDRQRRFQTAQEFAEDLQRYLDDLPIVSRRIGPFTRAFKAVNRHRRLSVGIGVALAVIVVLLVWVGVTRLEDERLLAESLRTAEDALWSGDVEVADKLLAGAGARRPDDPRVALLRHRLVAVRLLEEILDRTIEGLDFQDVGLMQPLMARLEDSLVACGGWAAATGDRAHAWVLVRALYLIRERNGDPRRALPLLEGRSGRAAAALRALALGEELRDLPPAGDRAAQEHLFTFLALREAERSRQDQYAELALALQGPDGRGDDRVLYARAVWLAEDEDQAVAARVAFEGLEGGGEALRPALLRNLARINLILGDLDAARRMFEEYRGRFPDEDRWTPREAATFHELLRRQDQEVAARDLLDRAIAAHPDHWKLLMIQATELGTVAPDRAVQLARKAASVARRRWRRERAVAQELLLTLIAMPNGGGRPGDLDPEEREQLRELHGRAEEELTRCRDPQASSDLHYLQARVAGRLGAGSRADELRAALDVSDRNFAAALDLGFVAFEAVGAAGAPKPPELVADALEFLTKMLERGYRGVRVPRSTELLTACWLKGVLSFADGDRRTASLLLADVLQLIEDDDRLAADVVGDDPRRFEYFARVLEAAGQ